MAKADFALNPMPLSVRTAMRDGIGHSLQDCRGYSLARKLNNPAMPHIFWNSPIELANICKHRRAALQFRGHYRPSKGAGPFKKERNALFR